MVVWRCPSRVPVKWTFRPKTWKMAPVESHIVLLNPGRTLCPLGLQRSMCQVRTRSWSKSPEHQNNTRKKSITVFTHLISEHHCIKITTYNWCFSHDYIDFLDILFWPPTVIFTGFITSSSRRCRLWRYLHKHQHLSIIQTSCCPSVE